MFFLSADSPRSVCWLQSLGCIIAPVNAPHLEEKLPNPRVEASQHRAASR